MRLIIGLLFLVSFQVEAQEYNLVMDRFGYDLIDKQMQQSVIQQHTAFKPWRKSDVLKTVLPDTAAGVPVKNPKRWIGRALWTNNFLNLDSSEYQLYVNPLFSFDIGKDNNTGTTTYLNSRGLELFGNLGKKVSFYTSFYENQGRFVNYVDSFIVDNQVVPGQGRVKPFGTGGWDYAMATGYVSYTPSKFFNFQFGNDKQFIGDGYRSLFLSDNAFNFPYFKVTSTFWKLRYTNLFVSYQNIGNAANSGIGGYLQKFATYHHLSYNATKWLNIGLFETIVWQGGDSTGARRGFDVNYLNPIIFYRPVEFSRGSPDNVLIGLNFKAMILKKYQLYGQLLLDEFSLKEVAARNGWWANKQALQLGWKFFDFLGVKNLTWQNELNIVRPYTYGHFTADQSYTHYAQPLAHPLGANFVENVQFLRYRYRRWGIEGKILLAQYGADTLRVDGTMSNLGQNPFVGTAEIGSGPLMVPNIYGNAIGQGLKNTVMFTDLTASYLINSKTNMRLEAGVSRRTQQNDRINTSTIWLFFSFKTTIPNRYYDF
ncbi:MAG: hypothetical protein WED33_09495 [Bacteroidia bacterium]